MLSIKMMNLLIGLMLIDILKAPSVTTRRQSKSPAKKQDNSESKATTSNLQIAT
jgi:hypothetical protein